MKLSQDPSLDIMTLDRASRKEYESGTIYQAGSICAIVDPSSPEYTDRLLARKFELLLSHYRGGIALDLCCATGKHLLALSPRIDYGIGIDFSAPFIAEARIEAARTGCDHVDFICSNARQLPIGDNTIDILYSFSSLYVMPSVHQVIDEIARVLRIGGCGILDLGNVRSLNTLCLRSYPELPRSFHVPIGQLLDMCHQSGLAIIEHKAFQLLPLWADRPRWMKPLLHPAWKRLFGLRWRGRMLDERISSMPIIRRVAFRHILVCEKLRRRL